MAKPACLQAGRQPNVWFLRDWLLFDSWFLEFGAYDNIFARRG